MKRSFIIVAMVVGSFLVSGLVDGYVGLQDGVWGVTHFAHGIVIAILCFAWCKADAQENGFDLPPGSPILCAAIAPIGIPLYLFRTRPFRRASVGTLKGVGVLILSVLVDVIGIYGGELVAA